MKNKVSKVAVIGSSEDGYEVAENIAKQIKLGKESALIIMPHIHSRGIYNALLKSGKKVKPILNNQTIEAGHIYVGMEDPLCDYNDPESTYGYGLRRELHIKKGGDECKFFLGRYDPDYINRAFSEVANIFKDKSIGVTVYGIGGAGVEGTKKIKEAGGKSLVQKVEDKDKDCSYQVSTPYNVIKNCEVDYILPPKELGEKLEELLR